MALFAVFDQNGPDALLEKSDLVGGEGCVSGRSGDVREEEAQEG